MHDRPMISQSAATLTYTGDKVLVLVVAFTPMCDSCK